MPLIKQSWLPQQHEMTVNAMNDQQTTDAAPSGARLSADSKLQELWDEAEEKDTDLVEIKRASYDTTIADT
ncbi:hypothetical protein Cpir12675_002790 [Ceratocystis pirilliformis]|uniref:Uncharacterized protein n=1 Tax=Ceratocystis pirilliformis TaxID=259994 RepID=A0ABR3Z704_9PEZI